MRLRPTRFSWRGQLGLHSEALPQKEKKKKKEKEKKKEKKSVILFYSLCVCLSHGKCVHVGGQLCGAIVFYPYMGCRS